MTKRINLRAWVTYAFALVLFVGLSACSDDANIAGPEEEIADEAVTNAGSSTVLESVFSIDYDRQNNNYIVVGKSPEGDIDVWYGQHGNWTKLQDNRDIDNRYSPEEFADFSIGDGDAMFGVAIGNKDGKGTSINAREFYDKPWFGDGRPEAIGTLDEVFAVEYDVDNNQYYVVGAEGGQIDVYFGQHKSWQKLQENRDIDNRYSTSEFVDFAVGDGDAMFGVVVGNKSEYKVAWRTYEPRCTSINAREFYDKPWFGDGRPKAVGALETCLSIDYDADNDKYYVVGVNGNGEIDVYFGQHGNWTKLQENRDIDNRYTPTQFVDFALGAEPGEAMFGVVVGNIEDYKIGFRQYAPRATSINGREFSDKPYFGDGAPKAIE